MGSTFLWLKAFHLISMVAWFAGLFYLPRLFVYHADTQDELSNQRFQTMERRLYYGIMTPAMLLTILFGISLAWHSFHFYITQGWFHGKLFLIALLIGFHHACGIYRKHFAQGRNRRSARFYRIFNEIPTILLIGIVVLAVVKPF